MRRLRAAEGPQSAGALAAALGVSRQLVVGDVALLRAGGEEILATPARLCAGARRRGRVAGDGCLPPQRRAPCWRSCCA